MAEIEEIELEESRTGFSKGAGHEDASGSTLQSGAKHKGKRRNSGGSRGSARVSPTGQVSEENRKENEGGRQQTDGSKQDVVPTQEDHRAHFHEEYRKVAQVYDKEFLKKHGEDLDTTLIFAGLFSAVTSAFIIQVDSQIQPDPNDETAALLRVLIYKIDKTTFGDKIPPLPQWTGPPRTMVQVQAVLFTSLAISLFCAFLAMLGKQWLNRYDSTDMQGSAIERSHNRQQKLSGIVAWYFNHVMDSLPLMLQMALFLLDCALSRYLWEMNITIACVLIGATSLGVLFYLLIVVVGSFSESFPYQTPSAHILRHIFYHYLPELSSASSITFAAVSSKCSEFIQNSRCCSIFVVWWSLMGRPWYSASNIRYTLIYYLPGPPAALAVDCYRLCAALSRSLAASSRRMYRRFITTLSPRPMYSLKRQTIASDLPCISWILQMSLDRDVRLSALKRLVSMPESCHLLPILVVDCFHVFIGCTNVSNGKVVIIQGLDQLAMESANGLFRTFHDLMVMDPTSSILADLHRRYNKVFPTEIDFTGLPFSSTMTKVHALVNRFGNPHYTWWDDLRLPSRERSISFSRRMMETAQVKYRQMQPRKVPRWMLRSALHFLSLDLDHLPAASVADYLTIVAIDLRCEVPDITTTDESERVKQVSSLIVAKLTSGFEALPMSKAITALVPYAIILGRGEDREMVDAISSILSVPHPGILVWHRVNPYLTTLFDKPSTPALNQIVTLLSPYVPWDDKLHDRDTVAKWEAAALEAPLKEGIPQSRVNALLQIASIDSLRLHVSDHLWEWLKDVSSLPTVCQGRSAGRTEAVVQHVRRLRNIEITKAYFLLIWSEWNFLYAYGLEEMRVSIREDFGGNESEHHRKELIARLDHVLEQLNLGWDYIEEHKPGINHYQLQRAKVDYRKLREALLEVEGAAAIVPVTPNDPSPV